MCTTHISGVLFNFQIDDKGNDAFTKFELIDEELQESFYRELGVNVIWIDEYSEIPKLLAGIKKKK